MHACVKRNAAGALDPLRLALCARACGVGWLGALSVCCWDRTPSIFLFGELLPVCARAPYLFGVSESCAVMGVGYEPSS